MSPVDSEDLERLLATGRWGRCQRCTALFPIATPRLPPEHCRLCRRRIYKTNHERGRRARRREERARRVDTDPRKRDTERPSAARGQRSAEA